MLLNNAKIVSASLNNLNKKFNNKTILITGSNGFIGINLIYYFFYIKKKFNINCSLICIDIKAPLEKHSLIFKSGFIKFIKKDVFKLINFPKSDFIIHCASIASPTFYRLNPLQTIDANVFAYRNMLEFFKDQNCKSLLYFSSSEIYGNPDSKNIPTKESYNGNVSCIGPRSCYDESKRFGETLSIYFNKTYGMPIKIARPFNNYGPGLNILDKRVLPDIFKSIVNKKNIELFSNGNTTRTFCYIADAIDGYLRLLLSNHNVTPFNIGYDREEISMIELAKKCINKFNPKLKIVFKKNRDRKYNVDSPERRRPNINKAKKLLSYKPKINLDKGLQYTFCFYCKELEK